MLQGTQYKILVVLPTKKALKSTIDLLKQNVTKVSNTDQVLSSIFVYGSSKVNPKFSIEQRAIEMYMRD